MTEMVVVSGCESGKGGIVYGETMYGLKRAFAVAGARSTLLTLWKIDDDATVAFMEAFYKKLKVGMARTDALIETQREFRNGDIKGPKGEEYSHTFYWAPFQLTGDWRPIKNL